MENTVDEIKNSGLLNEYEQSFSDEERVNHLMKLTSDSYSKHFESIDVKQIGLSEPIKLSRQETMKGLTTSVKELGILEPIHVMTADEDSTFKYILLTGFRRLYAALRNNYDKIDAIVWDFKDKEKGVDIALYLGLLLNRTQRRKWSEVWHLYQILELQTSVTPSTMEYLLQLDSGDAMRLKDVMLCDYEDIKQELLMDKMSLDKAYKALTKKRKEEDLLEKEDNAGVAQDFEGAEDLSKSSDGEQEEPTPQLSDADVRELLDMVNELDNNDEVTEDDFETLNQAEDEQQKVGERHPLDPALKMAVLNRDEFKCKCCGFGGPAALGILAVHHIIPVHCGGKDSMENLTTLCLNHHLLLHIAERNGGKLQMSKEDFYNYTEEEQKNLVRTLNLAKIAVKADKQKKLSTDEVKKATESTLKHPMPGHDLKENQTAYTRNKSSGKAKNKKDSPPVQQSDDEDDF